MALSFANILLCARGTVSPRRAGAGRARCCAHGAPPTAPPHRPPFRPRRPPQNEGRLDATPEVLLWRSRADDKAHKVPLAGARAVSFYDMGRACQLWVSDASGDLHRFDGFRAGEYDKLAAFFSAAGLTLARKELATKGRNWGSLRLSGAQLELLDDAGKLVAPIPLSAVSQAAQPGKGEVEVHFYDDDTGEERRGATATMSCWHALAHCERSFDPPPPPPLPLPRPVPPQSTARTRR